MTHSSGKYILGHVGDTRIYHLSDTIQILTEDHTLIARELQRGNLTIEQAEQDSRRNVLMQCIGVNEYLKPQSGQGRIEREEAFLLCSDGFRHKISSSEIRTLLNPGRFHTSGEMRTELLRLVELNKQRKETDNITAIYIKRV